MTRLYQQLLDEFDIDDFSANDDLFDPVEEFDREVALEEIEIWARRALAANGFGDY